MEGLHTLPHRLKPSSYGKERADDTTRAESGAEAEAEAGVIAESPLLSAAKSSENTQLSQVELMEQQCSVLRSIFNSNIAACHIKLVRHCPRTLMFWSAKLTAATNCATG